MKITPSLSGRYRPRVSATYVLLSPNAGTTKQIEVQTKGRALRASPLIGEKVSTRVFSSALNGKDTATKGTLLLSNGLDQLLLSDGASSLEFELSAFNPFFIAGKAVSDIATFSDSVVFSVSTVRSNTMVGGDSFSSAGAGVLSLTSNGATADSGLIFTQGYTDTLDYFAQDYVGTSRSF